MITKYPKENLKQVLLMAADLIDKGWCKKYLAINVDGRETDPICNDAIAWCAAGALEKASYCYPDSNLTYKRAIDVTEEKISRAVTKYKLTWFNDMIAQEASEVSNLFRKVAEELK